MSIRDEAAEVFAEAHGEESLGSRFSMAGLSYGGTFDAERTEILFEEKGQREAVRRTCVALKSQWMTKPDPALRPEVIYGATTYVLVGPIGEDDVHYTLTLEKRT